MKRAVDFSFGKGRRTTRSKRCVVPQKQGVQGHRIKGTEKTSCRETWKGREPGMSPDVLSRVRARSSQVPRKAITHLPWFSPALQEPFAGMRRGAAFRDVKAERFANLQLFAGKRRESWQSSPRFRQFYTFHFITNIYWIIKQVSQRCRVPDISYVTCQHKANKKNKISTCWIIFRRIFLNHVSKTRLDKIEIVFLSIFSFVCIQSLVCVIPNNNTLSSILAETISRNKPAVQEFGSHF